MRLIFSNAERRIEMLKGVADSIVLQYHWIKNKDVKWLSDVRNNFDYVLINSGGTRGLKKHQLDSYHDKYVDWLSDNRKYFDDCTELDAYGLVSIDTVEGYRKRIEEIGLKPIPICTLENEQKWALNHFDGTKKVVAIGNIGVKDNDDKTGFLTALAKNTGVDLIFMKYERWVMISERTDLQKYSYVCGGWVDGSKYGVIYHFDGTDMKRIKDREESAVYRAEADKVGIDRWNLEQFVKYQNYINKP